MSEFYIFENSYKHKFVYRRFRDGKRFEISGDIYRDVFMPEFDEDQMTYFKTLEGVTVLELPDKPKTKLSFAFWDRIAELLRPIYPPEDNPWR